MSKKEIEKKSPKINATIEVIGSYESSVIPQADNISKIVTIIEVLRHSYMNEKDISTGFGMASRQADYYANALRYLGLINTVKYGKNNIIGLTEPAMKLFATGSVEKKLKLFFISENIIETIDNELKIAAVSEATVKRRTKTLEAWRKWVDNE